MPDDWKDQISGHDAISLALLAGLIFCPITCLYGVR